MSEMIGAGVPASPLEEEEEVGVGLIDGGSLHMEEGKSPVPVAAGYLTQKIMAEMFGTYIMMFAGCTSVVVNLKMIGGVALPWISLVFGLVVMVMIYAVGHISGAHFNPAITIAFATCKRFPWKQVPAYISAQVFGSTLASVTLRLLLDIKQEHYFGTVPTVSNLQSLALEIIISFTLMFVISGVATDNRAIGELAGFAVGATVLLNILSAGSVSGASMNPVRSLGPAIVFNRYEGIWVYIVGPICGTVMGAWAYNLIRYTDKPLHKIIQSTLFRKCRCVWMDDELK